MIDPAPLIVWLNAIPLPVGVSYKWVRGPRVPEFGQADLVAVVTPLEGPGLALESAANLSSFQLQLTGREFVHDTIQKAAFAIDDALVLGDYPADLWGTRVQYVTRTGGAPAPIQEDEHDRIAYVCSYIVHEMPER